MDLGIVGAIVMLVAWGIAALVMEGPGWVHLLLTVGTFLLIYRVVARSTPPAPTPVDLGKPGGGAKKK